MKYKLAVFILGFLLVATNIFWAYSVVDQTVSFDHLKTSFKYRAKTLGVMKELLLEFGGKEDIDKEQLVENFKERYPSYIVKEDSGLLFVESIGLRFKDGKLVDVIYAWEPIS